MKGENCICIFCECSVQVQATNLIDHLEDEQRFTHYGLGDEAHVSIVVTLSKFSVASVSFCFQSTAHEVDNGNNRKGT